MTGATIAHQDITARARFWRENPDGAFVLGPPHCWQEVKAVLKMCDDTWSTSSRVFNSADPRVQVVLDRFCDGFTVAQLCEAIAGSKHEQFIASRPSLQVVTTLLKSAAAVDKYSRLVGVVAAGAPTVQPASPQYYGSTGFEQAIAAGPTQMLQPNDQIGGTLKSHE